MEAGIDHEAVVFRSHCRGSGWIPYIEETFKDSPTIRLGGIIVIREIIAVSIEIAVAVVLCPAFAHLDIGEFIESGLRPMVHDHRLAVFVNDFCGFFN